MLRLIASTLALLIAFSFLPLSSSEAGNRTERHRIIKQQKYNMIDGRANRYDRRHTRRAVARATVVVRVEGGGRSFHRHYRQGDTYSGDVIIDVRNGVGQWSYGSYSSSVVAVSVRPKLKIIDVGTLKVNGACAMQAGVCVIRP